MYFDFEDYRPDTPTIDSAISRREGILLSIVAHAVVIAFLIFVPELPWVQAMAERAREAAIERLARERELREPRFVFVQPRVDVPSPTPPPRADFSDLDRQARTRERAPEPTNSMPFARGNTSEMVEAQEQARSMGNGPGPEPREAAPGASDAVERAVAPVPSDQASRAERLTAPAEPSQRAAMPGGSLGDALRNLQRYVENQSFENQQGGAGEFGPDIQFDTKGVEFGPWIRRFIAQIKRNWFVPYAAMALKGHVVITFNVHKDGSITDLTVLRPSSVDAFNHSAMNALAASNPTQPLPPEYPSDKAFFTVTFYYNETPP